MTKKAGPVFDAISIINNATETDFSSTQQTDEFTKNTVQTVISNTPVIGPGLDQIMDQSRTDSSIFNLDNNKMSKGYSSGLNATQKMIESRIKQRQKDAEKTKKNN